MDQKVKIKVQQGKVGSLANVKHKPGGGDKKIFNDVEYMRQVSDHAVPISGQGSLTSSRRESSSQVFLYFCLFCIISYFLPNAVCSTFIYHAQQENLFVGCLKCSQRNTFNLFIIIWHAFVTFFVLSLFSYIFLNTK